MQQHSSFSEIDDPRLANLPAFPTMHNLPSEDPEEPGLPDDYHDLQLQLLSRTLKLTDTEAALEEKTIAQQQQ